MLQADLEIVKNQDARTARRDVTICSLHTHPLLMLNPDLYHRLMELFGTVRVSNANISGQTRLIPDWNSGGKLRVAGHRAAGGHNVEHYAVDCPFCGDRRQRLSFDYRYGTPHPVSGKPQVHLIKCFNETDCFDADQPGSSARRQELWDQVRLGTGSLRALPSTTDCVRQNSVQLPGNLSPIIAPEIPRETRAYLASRRFDRRELWERWRVYYCEECYEAKPIIRHERLVIPIYGWQDDGSGQRQVVVAGWQARLVDDELVSDSNPKYLTASGFSAGASVYGLTSAAETEGPIVICEGITDVWRLGTNAVAIFGKKGKLGLAQEREILNHANGRAVVFFADANAVEETSANIQPLLKSARSRNISIPKCAIAVPPPGREDAGECTREEAWEAVAEALGRPVRQLGVDLAMKTAPRHPRNLPR